MSPHDRIREHTADDVNRRIEQEVEDAVRVYSGADPDVIARRIDKVEQEWDVDRALMLNLSVIALPFAVAGFFSDRRFLAMPLIQLGFLMVHATVGWCPPLPVFRHLGFRSRHEIEAELSALRGLKRGAGVSEMAPLRR